MLCLGHFNTSTLYDPTFETHIASLVRSVSRSLVPTESAMGFNVAYGDACAGNVNDLGTTTPTGTVPTSTSNPLFLMSQPQLLAQV